MTAIVTGVVSLIFGVRAQAQRAQRSRCKRARRARWWRFSASVILSFILTRALPSSLILAPRPLQFGYLALSQVLGNREMLPPPPEALGL